MTYMLNNEYNVDPESLLSIPGKTWVYWKDLKGKYLGCNELMASSLGLSSPRHIVGNTDFDLGTIRHIEAMFYRDCDKQVASAKMTMQFMDSATFPDKKIRFVVIKMPLLYHGKLGGVVGLSHYLKEEQTQPHGLSKRQLQVLHYLVKGKTAKETAALLHLSPRTIEHNIDVIKTKLNCRSRSELILKGVEISE